MHDAESAYWQAPGISGHPDPAEEASWHSPAQSGYTAESPSTFAYADDPGSETPAARSSTFRGRAVPGAAHTSFDAEMIASALESVAYRVRAGELDVGSIDARASDAAAVAAALAALLGVRG
jgi:hypothetical protein